MEAVIERGVVKSRGTGLAHSRDRELVRFVGRHGVVAMRHVKAELGVGRTAAYRRVAACVERGLLERLELLRSEPGLLRATRDGLRYAGLGLPVASAQVGELPNGAPRSHRADLAVLAESGTIAIEVELTPKSPWRLQGLIRAWRYAIGHRVVAEVHYHCAPGQTRTAVERAVAKVRAEQFIAIGEAVSR
jgi:hypothetical protein